MYRYGETNPVVSDVDSATVFESGDLVYIDTDDAKPANTPGLWDTNIATTQEAFHDAFLGVAAQRTQSGETASTRVSTRGVFEFDCAAATFEVGDLVGPAKAAGDTLENQKVVAVASAALAIGRVSKRYGSNTTKVLVDVVSTIMYGGPQAMA